MDTERSPAVQPQAATSFENTGAQLETGLQVTPPSSGEGPSVLRSVLEHGHPSRRNDHLSYIEPELPPAGVTRLARSRDGHVRMTPRQQQSPGAYHPRYPQGAYGMEFTSMPRITVGERLDPTIAHAMKEKNRCAEKVLWTGYALNIAIGLQVLLGALTTALAAALANAKQAQISTTILGGLSTLVASYLARARGSGEPDLSIGRVKELECFLRECDAFLTDHAREYGEPGSYLDKRVVELRQRFEDLLGNLNEKKATIAGATVPTVGLSQSRT